MVYCHVKNSIPGYEKWASDQRAHVKYLQESRAVDETAALNAASQFALQHIHTVLYERQSQLESEIASLRETNQELVSLVTQLSQNFLHFQHHIQHCDNGQYAIVNKNNNNQPIVPQPDNDGE